MQASNAYLRLIGNGLKISFDFVKEMPRAGRSWGTYDLTSIIGPLPYVWTIQLLFPVWQVFMNLFSTSVDLNILECYFLTVVQANKYGSNF